MQLVSRYQEIVEKLLPGGTRRRYFYELILTGIRVLLSEGWRSFWTKLRLWWHIRRIKYVAARDRSVYIAGLSQSNHGSPVDIVVPVYNSFDWVRRCLSAVLSFTGNIPYRLIIVDDASTDHRVTEYLCYLQSRHRHVIVLRNTKNMGFLKSANRGMSFSNNDVVLLNSDAIVSHNWLAKLQACAYSDDRIATVTPLSNNATVCSVPEFCQDNALPDGYTVQEFASLVERCARTLGVNHYEIPVGIGFCMYIKRNVLSEVGVFDEEFGRGYEEEVEFCLRAREKGYRHIACPHVFVYHRGTTSTIPEQAQELERRNWNILVKRYPYYPQMVADFCARNPLSDIQVAIRHNIEERPAKPLSVGIDAQLLTRERWTGSERYISGLIAGLMDYDNASRYTVFTANCNADKYYNRGSFSRKYATDSTDILYDPDFYSLDVFHRPFQCYTVYDLLLLLNTRASVLTLLDLISYHHPEYFLNELDYQNYKRITELSAQLTDRIITISEYAKRDIVESLRVDPDKVDVIYPVLIDTNKFRRIEDQRLLSDFKAKYGLTSPYIFYIGTTFPHKNHEGLVSAYQALLAMEGIDRSTFPDLVVIAPETHLNTRKKLLSKLSGIEDKVKLLDYVPDDEIPLFYNCASLFVFPSLHEGFGLPLLEAMACGVPIVASNATSIPEVVGGAALLVDCTRPEQLADAIYNVLASPELWQELTEKSRKRLLFFSRRRMIEKTLATYWSAHQQKHHKRRRLSPAINAEIRQMANERGMIGLCQQLGLDPLPQGTEAKAE